MMEECDWKTLRCNYGGNVVSYLETQNENLIKTDSGAYLVSNITVLNNCLLKCQEMSTGSMNKTETEQGKITADPTSNSSINCSVLSQNFNRNKSIVKEVLTTPKLIDNTRKYDCTNLDVTDNFVVDSFAVKCYESCDNYGPQFTNVAVNTPKRQWDYDKIVHDMLNMNVGFEKMVDYQSCCNDIKRILVKFKCNHDKFKYYIRLRIILDEYRHEHSDNSKKISIKRLVQFFNIVCVSVIPLELFGSRKNILLLQRAMKEYCLTAYSESMTLTPHLCRFDINCIRWLKTIKHFDTKWALLAKAVKWLFDKFFIVILNQVFSVRKALDSEEKIFLSAEEWKYAARRYIQVRKKTGTFIDISADDSLPQSVPTGSMLLVPKSRGVRPILQVIYDKDSVAEVELMRTFLQQLYLSKYSLMTTRQFYRLWTPYSLKHKAKSDGSVCLVSCDVENAYGAINQSKLLEIVNEMIDEVPGDVFVIKWLAILSPSAFKWGKRKIVFKRWFSNCPQLPIIKSRSLFTYVEDCNHKTVFLSKNLIRERLRAYIQEQTFYYRRRTYLQKKGVPQGSALSTALSELYYSSMTDEELKSLMTSGTLIRFADDFLYITEKKELADRFLNAVRRGVRCYSCHFNTSKTQTNIDTEFCKKSDIITYLGYRINVITLDVNPDYGKVNFRYSKFLQRVSCKNSIKLFFDLLMNTAPLKLSRVVMDNKINSIEAIMTTVTEAANIFTIRCEYLISSIFDRLAEHSLEIMNAIRTVVKWFSTICVRYLSYYAVVPRKEVIRQIKNITWRSFYKVFLKNPVLRSFFIEEIKWNIYATNERIF